MPLYMDRHNLPGLTPEDAASAHLKDLEIQEHYGCVCITYWVDEERGNVFCLIQSPNKQTVSEMHSKAHGLIPHDIIEVDSNVVKAFLGRINDPDMSGLHDSSDPHIINDPAFRYLLCVDLKDRILLDCLHGKSIASQLVRNFNTLVRETVQHYAGRIVENHEEFLATFISATNAIDCAIYMRNSILFQNTCLNLPKVEIKIGLGSGFPVSGSSTLFGDALFKAKRYSFISEANRICLTPGIKEQYKGSASRIFNGSKSIRIFNAEEDLFLGKLLDAIQNAIFDPQISVEKLCSRLGVSSSGLYRNSMNLTGLSPNDLIKEIKLVNALNLLQKQNKNISETAYELSFTNPSYFTRCFKKRFNIIPADFLKTMNSVSV
jgi:AraC-like DNA-binding protein